MKAGIKIFRCLRGLTQEEVAKKMGISQSFFSRIERGRVKIPKRLKPLLNQALELPEDLLEKKK